MKETKMFVSKMSMFMFNLFDSKKYKKRNIKKTQAFCSSGPIAWSDFMQTYFF